MATQTISVSAFQTLCAEVADAIAGSGWSTAWSKYAQAEAVNAALEQATAGEGFSVTRRATLQGLQSALTAAQDATARLSQGRLIRTRTRHNP